MYKRQEQDHHSIRRNFIEETYEVCEAIDDEDTEHMKEELGDVLLQVCLLYTSPRIATTAQCSCTRTKL